MPNNVIEIVVKATDQITGPLRGIMGKISGLRTAIGSFAIALGLTAAFRAITRATIESQKAVAQLDAAYKATGATVGRTRGQLDDLAVSMQRTTVYEDELVKSAEAILLTFDKVRGEAFDRTIRASADLAARLGTDLPTATRTLGIALQEPEQGMLRLRRAGVLFSDAQKNIVKGFIDTGQAGAAQNFILSEIERRFKGAAVAARQTLGGALTALHNAFGDLIEGSTQSTKEVVASINGMTDALSDPKVKSGFDTIVTGLFNIAGAAVRAVGWIGNLIAKLTELYELGQVKGLKAQINVIEAFLKQNQNATGLIALQVEQRKKELAQLREQLQLLQLINSEKGNAGGIGASLARSRPTGGVAALAPATTPEQEKALDEWANAVDKINKKYDEQKTLLESIRVGRAADNEEVITANAALLVLAASRNKDLKDLSDQLGEATKKHKEQLDQWNKDTQTAQEKIIADWKEFNQKIADQMKEGLSQAVADARLKEKLDELLPEVVVTVRKIDTKPFTELSAAGKKAAEDIQSVFAAAFRSIFEGDSLRDITVNFLKAIREIPIQIAAEKIGEKIKKAITPAIERLFDPGKAARTAANEKILGAQRTAEAAKAAVPVINAVSAAAVKTTDAIDKQGEAAVSALEALCECMCGCMARSTSSDAVVGALEHTSKKNSLDVVEGVGRSIKDSTQSIDNTLVTVGQRIVGAVGHGGGGGTNWGKVIMDAYLKKSGGGAGGGYKSGMTMVGEEGPEMLMLPSGSRIMNQRQAAYQGGGASVVLNETHNIVINGASDAKETRQQLQTHLAMRDAKLEQRIMTRLKDNGFGRMH